MLRDFESILCFAAICKTGSLTGAARELNCSKAHVSRKLRDLEVRTGAVLFHRTTRRLDLTDAGRMLREDALQAHGAVQSAWKRARNSAEDLSGPFVVTAPLSVCNHLLADHLADLEAAFPDMRFQFLPTNERLDMIAGGIDLTIRSGGDNLEGLIAQPVGVARDVFFCREEDYGHYSALISGPAGLDECRLLVNPFSMSDDRLTLTGPEIMMDCQPGDVSLIGDYSLLVDLVARRGGVGLAPEYCLTGKPGRPAMRRLLPGWQGASWPKFIAHPYSAPVPRKVEAVSGLLKPWLEAGLRYRLA